MTQPVQEPLTQRSIASLQWGQNQLFRRPDPFGSQQSHPYCWATWIGSEDIAPNTLANPCVVGTPDVPYEESFIYDPDGLAGFEFDLDTGCLTYTQPGEYYIWAAASWNGTWTLGTTLGTVLDLGTSCSFSTQRVVNTIQSDLVNENMRIPVDWMSFAYAAGETSFRVLVYHNDTPGNDVGSVRIHAVQLNPNTDGEFNS